MSTLAVTYLKIFTLACLYSERTSGSEVLIPEVSHFLPCPEDYITVNRSCYKVGEESPYQSFQCDYVKIESEAENEYVKGLLDNLEDDSVWIGTTYGGFQNYVGNVRRRRASCHIMNYAGRWEAMSWYSCRKERRPVCEIRRKCEDTWVGEDCNRQCQCYKDTCNSGIPCYYGCQPGWVGSWCETEIPKPQVEHYCFKNNTHYTLMLLMDLKNNFTSLVPLDTDGFPINEDKYTNEYPNGLNMLQLTTEDLANPFHPYYNEKKIGDPASFAWSFRLREFNSVRLPNDLDFRVQCDFLDADDWYSSVSLDFKSGAITDQKPDPRLISLKMFLTEAYDIEPLSNITLGQPVRLAIVPEETTNDEDKAELSPRNCVARSADRKVKRQLIDEDGCPLEKDIFGVFRKKSSGVIITGHFRAFGLPGYSSYEISCDLVACYRSCQEDCRYRDYRRSVRDTQDPVFAVVSTSVTVK